MKRCRKIIAHRIPFDTWINSQLSIAKYYGGINFEGKEYVFDPACKKESNGKYKPDLITYGKKEVHNEIQDLRGLFD